MFFRTFVVALAIVAGVSGITVAQIQRDDPNTPDTLTIDSVVAYTNESGVIPVRFTNDESLAGIEVTLTLSSPDVQIDSFSFAGSRVESYSIKGTYSQAGVLSVYCFPFSGENTIPAGSGLLGQLHCSWSLDIQPQLVQVDTITIITSDQRQYSTTFSDISATPFTPVVNAGYVDIKQGFGCCTGIRGDVDNSGQYYPNVADLTYLVRFLFATEAPPDCPEEADVDGLNGPEANVGDLSYLVTYLFGDGPAPVDCDAK
jgi:hypothetical protein